MNDNLDLEALDQYLASEDSPEDCMMLSDLDGFLHGIICSPVVIPAEEWMVVALGSEVTVYLYGLWMKSKSSLLRLGQVF